MTTTYKHFAVRNGGCIIEADMPLENQGLVLIQGVNNDEGGSNGAGKSTLGDLLASIITGRTGKRSGEKSFVKKNDLLNLKNPRNFHTQLAFDKEGVEYLVNNYRKHQDWGTRIELWVDGEDKTPTTDIDDVQAKIMEILDITPDEFFGQTYLSQQYSHALVHGTPSQKKKFLSTYFGLEQIDAAAKVSQKFVNGIVIPNEAELDDLRRGLEQQLKDLPPENVINDNKKAADTLRGELQQRILDLRFQVEQQKKAKLVEEQSQAWEQKVAALGVSFTAPDMFQEITNCTNQATLLQREIQRLTEVSTINKQLEQLGVDTTQSYQEIRQQIEEHELILNKKGEDVAKLKVRAIKEQELGALPKTEKTLRDLSLELIQAQLEAKTYTANLNTLASEINKLSFKGTKCPTCLRAITEEEHKEMLSTRQHNHKQLQEVVTDLQQQVRDLQSLSTAKEQAMLLEYELSSLPTGDHTQATEELQNIKATKVTLQKLADDLVKVTALQDRLETLEASKDAKVLVEAHNLQEVIVTTTNKATVLRNAREWLLQNGQTKFDMHALGMAQSELDIIERKFTEANEAAINQATLLTTRNNTVKQIGDIERILAKNSEEKRRKRILEVINVTINSIKKAKLSEATGMLTGVLPHYISQLFPLGDVRIATPENENEFDLFLDKGDQQIPLYLVSGGQAKRVALAIFFAFAKMGTKSSNILLLDEADKDLDPLGREALYEVLQDLKFPSVFLTSHSSDQQKSKKYDQVWKMEMTNSVSRLIR
jgi:DNA repair exonuclease SbcCD ATPase subunit